MRSGGGGGGSLWGGSGLRERNVGWLQGSGRRREVPPREGSRAETDKINNE